MLSSVISSRRSYRGQCNWHHNRVTGGAVQRSSRTKVRSSELAHAATDQGPNCSNDVLNAALACTLMANSQPLGPSSAARNVTSRHRGAPNSPSIWAFFGGDQPVMPSVPFILWATALHSKPPDHYTRVFTLLGFCPGLTVPRSPYAIALLVAVTLSVLREPFGSLVYPFGGDTQSKLPPSNVRRLAVSTKQTGWVFFPTVLHEICDRRFKVSHLSTHHLSQLPITKVAVKRCMGPFRPVAGTRHLHRDYNFTGAHGWDSAQNRYKKKKTIRAGRNLTRQGISLPLGPL